MVRHSNIFCRTFIRNVRLSERSVEFWHHWFNNISVIYVTAHRCVGGLKKKLDLCSMVGLPCHRHFVGFFNVSVQAPTQGQPFYAYSGKMPHFSHLLRHAWGYGGPILILIPQGPHGGTLKSHAWHVKTCTTVTFYMKIKTRHVFVKHGCPRRQQTQNMAKISKSYILTPPHPQGHGISVKCEETKD